MTTRFPTTHHTAGTTYSRAGLYALPAGTWSATATVKTAGGTLVQALAVNLSELGSPDVDGNTHAMSVLATAAETATWPLQQLLCDIIFTDASVDPVKVPAVTVAINVSGHTPPLSDADNPLQVITPDMAPVLRGETGDAGAASTVPGPAGEGVPTGGTTGQVLAKASGTDYDTEWVAQTGGGGGGGATNLAYTASPTGGTVTSDTGTDATIPLADGTNAGLMTPAQKATLDATSGTNTGDQDLSGYSPTSHNHTGVYDPAGTAASAVSAHEGAADPHPGYALESALGSAAAASTADFAPAAHVGAGASAHANAIAAGAAGFMSGTDKSKLDGIASGADVTDIAAATHAATSKATPVDADELPLVDSAASWALKKLTWANLKATLKTYLDTLYQATLVSGTNIKTVNSTSILGSGDIAVSATPGGSTTQVQFNDGGAFGGDSGLTYNKAIGSLTTGQINISTGIINAPSTALILKVLSTEVFRYGAYNVLIPSSYAINWNNDTALNRNAAGVIEINNVSAGTYRDLKLRNLIASGNLTTGIVAKTANYTATANDGSIEVDATSGAVTITLPAVSGAAGRIYTIKKTDASGNAVTVDPNASETIDGATTASLASQYSTITIQANAAGTAWHKVSGV